MVLNIHSLNLSTLLTISVVLRVALIVYSEWHDAHSVVKYTDVDYRVFTDAAHFVLYPGPNELNRAQGPLRDIFSAVGHLGDPYTRETYRYTPLLALLMVPNEWFPSFGKYLFALCDIMNGILLQRILSSVSRSSAGSGTQGVMYSALYLLNPLVFSISTRGSSESILSLAVLSTLYATLQGKWDSAALLLGLSTHWKIFPFIYGFSCIFAIHRTSGQPFKAMIWNPRIWRFGLLSVGTFIALGASCYAIWGPPFLENTYMYHLHRLDHRHNFSPYFYPTYLTYPGSESAPTLSPVLAVLSSPLISFVPQLALSIGAGVIASLNRQNIPLCWFIQTTAFVLFNKVCTSQYFLWYLHFIPVMAPKLHLSTINTILLVLAWIGAQALWLAEAYKLEFLGSSVFLNLWTRSLIYCSSHCAVMIFIMRAYHPQKSNLS